MSDSIQQIIEDGKRAESAEDLYDCILRLERASDGKVLTPVEPTDKMLDAGVAMALQVSVHGQGGWSNYIRDLYKQMLSAAPKD